MYGDTTNPHRYAIIFARQEGEAMHEMTFYVGNASTCQTVLDALRAGRSLIGVVPTAHIATLAEWMQAGDYYLLLDRLDDQDPHDPWEDD